MINEIETRHFMLAEGKGFGIVIPQDSIFSDFDEAAIKEWLGFGVEGDVFITTLGQIPVHHIAPQYIDPLLNEKGLLENRVVGVKTRIEVSEANMLLFENKVKNNDFNAKLIKVLGVNLDEMGITLSIRNDGQCTIIEKKSEKILAVSPNLNGALLFHEGMVQALRARVEMFCPSIPEPIVEVSVEEEPKNDK